MKRRLTIQEQRSDLDIPRSAWDAWDDAWSDIEEDAEYWGSYDGYWRPWLEDVMPEWTWGFRLDPLTYWHPWSECPSSS